MSQHDENNQTTSSSEIANKVWEDDRRKDRSTTERDFILDEPIIQVFERNLNLVEFGRIKF